MFRTAKVHIRHTPLSSEQHVFGEKSSQELHGGNTSIRPMEVDPFHEELTLQTDSEFPSVSCNAAAGHRDGDGIGWYKTEGGGMQHMRMGKGWDGGRRYGRDGGRRRRWRPGA